MLVAGVLLLAHEHQRVRGLPGPTVEEITAATGVSRSRAYEVRDELRRVLPSVLRPRRRLARSTATWRTRCCAP